MPAGARGESPPSLPASPSALSSLPLPAAAAQGRRERRRQAEPPGPAEAGGRAGGRWLLPGPGPAAPPAGSARRSHGAAAPRQVRLRCLLRRAAPSRAEPTRAESHGEVLREAPPLCDVSCGVLRARFGGGGTTRKVDGEGGRRTALLLLLLKLLPLPRGCRTVPGLGLSRGSGGRGNLGAEAAGSGAATRSPGETRRGGSHPRSQKAREKAPAAVPGFPRRPLTAEVAPIRMRAAAGARSGGKTPLVLPWDFSTLRPTRTSCYGAGGGDGEESCSLRTRATNGSGGGGGAGRGQVSCTARSPVGQWRGGRCGPRAQPQPPGCSVCAAWGCGRWGPQAGHGRDLRAARKCQAAGRTCVPGAVRVAASCALAFLGICASRISPPQKFRTCLGCARGNFSFPSWLFPLKIRRF